MKSNSISFVLTTFLLGSFLLGCGGSDEASEPVVEEDTTIAGCLTSEDCEDDLVCDPYLNEGSGECVFCIAGESVCEGSGLKTCLPDGTAFGEVTECETDDPCMVTEGCVDGACDPPEPKDCGDEDPCTHDYCQPYSGECLNPPNAEPGCCEGNQECDDGLECTEDVCDALNGVCSNLGGPCTEQLGQWGSKGSEDGALKFPSGVAVLNSGEVVVSDQGNNRLSVFSRVGEFSRHLDAELPDVPLSNPSGLTVFSDGKLAVADTGNDRVVLYGEDGSFSMILDGDGALDGPTDVAIASHEGEPEGSLWIVNNAADNVVQLSLGNKVVRKVGDTGDSDGKFRRAFSVETDSQGRIMVTDKELNRIQLIDPVSEEALAIFGSTGAADGQFNQIGGIAKNWTGDLFVADPDNQRIQKLSQCTPVCDEGVECGTNRCGGKCAGCLGAATCVDGVCTAEFPGEADCEPSGAPGCDGCGCEACVCEQDDFCCATAWDEICVDMCTQACGAACPDPNAESDLQPAINFSGAVAGPFIAPLQVYVDRENVLWVVDSVAAKITSFQLSP